MITYVPVHERTAIVTIGDEEIVRYHFIAAYTQHFSYFDADYCFYGLFFPDLSSEFVDNNISHAFSKICIINKVHINGILINYATNSK